MQQDTTAKDGKAKAPLPSAFYRDCGLLSEGASAKARGFLQGLAAELAERKDRRIEEMLSIQEDFEREAGRIEAERYDPARQRELIDGSRSDHLLHLRQALERQNRTTSDWVLKAQDRWRAIVRSDAPDSRRPAATAEARLLGELLDLARRSYARDVLARGDAQELSALWQYARRSGDAGTLDLVADREPEGQPPTLASEVAQHRNRREGMRRLEQADELARWIQREQTVTCAVYDSVAEAIARSK